MLLGKLLGPPEGADDRTLRPPRPRFGEGLGGAHRREPPGGHGGPWRTAMRGVMTAGRALASCCLAAVAALALADAARAETWRGLTVAPEERCSAYDRQRDYRYPSSIEREIVRRLGAVYGPYTGTCFASTYETDIEHNVATSEAHDSGLCTRDRATRMRFATDLRNLTLASPSVNRHRKGGKDAAEWLPARNRCWFAAPRRGGAPRLRFDHRPARGGRPGADPRRMRKYRAGAVGMPREYRTGPGHWHRLGR